MSVEGERDPQAVLGSGWVARELEEEFPRLGLTTLVLPFRPVRSPRAVKQRMRDMSSRFRGADAVTMRQSPVPWAYRVFYRHIGLDPDHTRTPVEEAAVERLLRGEFRSQNLLDDALTISLIETGVAILALDSDRVEGTLGVRTAGAGERLGRTELAPGLAPGRLVIADERSPLAILFGELAPAHGVSDRTERVTLVAVRVGGVPEIHVEESLWSCVEVLRS